MAAGSPPVLSVRDVSVELGGRAVVRSASFTLAPGELLVLMGPNGSGKSTLLRALVGFEPIRAGAIDLEGRDIRRVPPHRRGLVLLGQDPGLFSHRTVYDNVAYAPRLRRSDESTVSVEVGRALELVRLSGFERRLVDQLSGGERQRVALARALAARPSVLLLDEPFEGLDPDVRGELRTEFREALRAARVATVLVTHDREEGLRMGDRTALLFDGRIVAEGPTEAIFAHPPSPVAARFLGYAVWSVDGISIAGHPSDARWGDGRLASGLPATVIDSTVRGSRGWLRVRLSTGPSMELELDPNERTPEPGTTGTVDFRRLVRYPRDRPEDRPLA